MGFVERSGKLEAVANLDRAAEQRFFDGLALAAQDEHRTAAIYLMGYGAEIMLKVACYRASGLRRWDPVAARFNSLKSNPIYRVRGKPNGHGFIGWFDILVDERQRAGNPLPPDFRRNLESRALRLEKDWTETLRYRRTNATPAELNRVFECVNWILKHRTLL